MTKSILVVEDHPLYRAALVHMLQDIVGKSAPIPARSAEEGLRLIESGSDVGMILLDLNLPGVNGMEAIQKYRRKCPGVPVVVVSASEERREASAALRAGAIAFVSKAASSEALGDVVKRLLDNKIAKPEWITASGKVPLEGMETLNLTDRQDKILSLLLKGHSNKEIGLHLDLAEITVKVHVSALFRLLGVVNRTQAVLAARNLGLGSDYIS